MSFLGQFIPLRMNRTHFHDDNNFTGITEVRPQKCQFLFVLSCRVIMVSHFQKFYCDTNNFSRNWYQNWSLLFMITEECFSFLIAFGCVYNALKCSDICFSCLIWQLIWINIVIIKIKLPEHDILLLSNMFCQEQANKYLYFK